MSATLDEIAARLGRIETMLAGRSAPTAAEPVTLTYTPKEFAQRIGRSYRWVVDRCAAGVIPTLSRRRPYLIPASAAETMFSTGKTIFSR